VLARQRLTRLTSACFRSRAPGPVSGQLYDSDRSEDRSSCCRFPVAFQLPAFASWASCSRTEFSSPHGRPTTHALKSAADRNGVSTFHTRETAGSGALLTPEATVSTRPSMSPRSPSADFQRLASLSPRHYFSDPESCRDEASTRVHHIHPFGLSLTCNIQSEWMPLGFSLSFAPGNYSPRTSGREPVSDTDRELRLGHFHPTSNRRTHSTRATSCRTTTRHERMHRWFMAQPLELDLPTAGP
jgi:hypothetical protein